MAVRLAPADEPAALARPDLQAGFRPRHAKQRRLPLSGRARIAGRHDDVIEVNGHEQFIA
jgi:hypothetical protein